MAASILLGVVVLLPSGPAVASAPPSPVLVDAVGRCGALPTSHAHWNATCRQAKGANAVTDTFIMPRGPWGIAFAFHCRGVGDFSVVVGLPGLDGNLPTTAIFRHRHQGAWFKMETGKGWQELNSVPIQWRSPQNLQIRSTCAWHVRAVRGGRAVVHRYIPPIPA
jgi:hypothetical protein